MCPHAVTTVHITGPTTAAKGSSETYTLTVTNPSTSTAFNVILQGSLPIGFLYQSSQPPGTYANGIVTWNIGDLAPGNSAQVTVTVTIVIDTSATEGSTLILTDAAVLQCPVGASHGPSFATLPIVIAAAPPPPPPPPQVPQQLPADGASTGTLPQVRRLPADLNNEVPGDKTTGSPGADQAVDILTNVVNHGGETGSCVVALRINGKIEQTKKVSVSPGIAHPVRFTVTKSQPGTYTVDIGNEHCTFVVAGQQKTQFSQHTIELITALATLVLIILPGLLIITLRRRVRS